MKLNSQPSSGMTLVEIMITTVLIAVLGLTVFSLLDIGTILGAKNSAVNTAHQQARTAMLQMMQDLHSAVSLPYLIDTSGNAINGAGPAPGIAFQLWSMGPYRIKDDEGAGGDHVHITLPSGAKKPVKGQRLIIPTHQIEDKIITVSGTNSDLQIELESPLPVEITGTSSNYIICYITDRCSYTVVKGSLNWKGPTTKKTFAVLGGNITNPTPFSTPTTPAGALYYRFVAAIDLSTADSSYSNRKFKAANILLNGQVPMRARLTTYQ